MVKNTSLVWNTEGNGNYDYADFGAFVRLQINRHVNFCFRVLLEWDFVVTIRVTVGFFFPLHFGEIALLSHFSEYCYRIDNEKWRQLDSSRRWYLRTKLHGVTYQKTVSCCIPADRSAQQTSPVQSVSFMVNLPPSL